MASAERNRVAIYARISEDPLHREKGVVRQVEDCRALAAARGWTVVDEYVDNDVSAFTGRRRDRYEALMARVDAREVDRVVAYMTSRLWRSRAERAHGIERLREARVGIAAVKGPELDLSTAAGRMIADVLGSFDTMESDVKGERVRRAAQQRAEEGRANGTIPYGWTREYVRDERGRVLSSRDVENPETAAVVREIVDRLLAGESQKELVADLNTRAIPSPLGKAWRPSSVRKIALRESNVARRVHQGEVVGPAAWPGIVDEDKHARVVALLTDPARMTSRGGARKHLLTYGFGECGVCGAVLRVVTRAGYSLYVCDSPRGCVGRRQERVDSFVDEVIVERLGRPDAAGLVRVDDTAAREARAKAEAILARLDTAADEYSAGNITAEQLRRITATLRPQLDDSQTAARRALRAGIAEDLVGPDVEDVWSKLPVSRKREAFSVLGVRVRILPTRQGPGFDPKSVEVLFGEFSEKPARGLQ